MVEETGSGVAERESVNEYREKMMSKAIARVCTMSREEYEKKVRVPHDIHFSIFLNIIALVQLIRHVEKIHV